jgi:thiol-disulfide isomerase/thioredoxin
MLFVQYASITPRKVLGSVMISLALHSVMARAFAPALPPPILASNLARQNFNLARPFALRRPLFALVADEKEELNKHKKGEDASDWTETPDGGFIPNFLLQNRNDRGAGMPATSKGKRLISMSTDTRASPLITEVKTLQEYKAVVADEREKMVVVRFYAPWCRACRAVAAPFRQLAQRYQGGVKFVEVPLTPDNAVLHQGLGVPSLPYGHIYHPEAGLVEERSMNKKRFGEFTEILQSYVTGECAIDWEENDEAADSS